MRHIPKKQAPKKQTVRTVSLRQRREARAAADVLDRLFGVGLKSAKSVYIQFLAGSIDEAARENPGGWGATLYDWGIRFNAGWVESLVLFPGGLRILVHRSYVPDGIRLEGKTYRHAAQCDIVTIPLRRMAEMLPGLAKAHRLAIDAAARRPAPKAIRKAHSTGITTFLSEYLGSRTPDPSYCEPPTLHLVNGGYGSDDKDLLEEIAAGDRRASSWVVPKSANIDDEVVINMAAFGLFATAKVASLPKLRADKKNRYGADLHSIKLIEPPISLAAVQALIPNLGWARSPQSVTTPSPQLSDQIRSLIWGAKSASEIEEPFELSSRGQEELLKIASFPISASLPPKRQEVWRRIRSGAVVEIVMRRANGQCEGCNQPAPFRRADGSPFLESHHTVRVAEDGLDHPMQVIALCPNCHRRTDFGEDKEAFNQSLILRLAERNKKKECR